MTRFTRFTRAKGAALFLLISIVGWGCASQQPAPESSDSRKKDEDPEAVQEDRDLRETEVSFDAAGMTVHGTLTRPTGDGPVPAVLLIAGSGPTDRDWNSPLLAGKHGSGGLLSRELARHGIASLRYDKRGTGATGMPETLSWADYHAEQKAGIELLKSRDFVDPERIVVAGHSEGGAHALDLVRGHDVDVAGVALLATAGRSLRQLILWQIDNQLKAAGLSQTQIVAHQTKLEKALDRFAAGEKIDPATASSYPGVQNLVASLQADASVDFVRDFLVFDPVLAVSQIDVPMLILTGGKDVQVDPELDAEMLAKAARESKKNVKFVLAPNADHVFKEEARPRAELTGQDAVTRYNAADRSLDPVVVDALVGWIEGLESETP